MVTLQEADMGLHIVRPASLKHEVVKLGPAVYPHELIVITSKPISGSGDYQFLDSLKSDALDTGLIMFCITAAILAFAAVASRRSASVRSFMRDYSNAWRQMGEAILGQEWASPALWSQRVLWLSTSLAIFVIVFGYLTNYISTDQFIEIPPRTVDLVDDLFDPYFAQMRLVMSLNFFFFEHMQGADPKSRSGQLFTRMSKDNNCSQPETCNLMLFSSTDLTKASAMTAAIVPPFVESKFGFLIDKSVVEQSQATIGCKVNPKFDGKSLIDRLHLTRDDIVSDYSAVFFSQQADPQTVKYASYVVQTFVEIGIIRPYSQEAAEIVLGGLYPTDDEYYKCVYPAWPTIESEATPFPLKVFIGPFIFMGKLILIAIAILVFEVSFTGSQSNAIKIISHLYQWCSDQSVRAKMLRFRLSNMYRKTDQPSRNDCHKQARWFSEGTA
ncbi:hypothetical protein HDE_08881 [Halotydeus destructor]|nr:hypothetical protein HDE_08881 [Halotydeus destructor]